MKRTLALAIIAVLAFTISSSVASASYIVNGKYNSYIDYPIAVAKYYPNTQYIVRIDVKINWTNVNKNCPWTLELPLSNILFYNVSSYGANLTSARYWFIHNSYFNYVYLPKNDFSLFIKTNAYTTYVFKRLTLTTGLPPVNYYCGRVFPKLEITNIVLYKVVGNKIVGVENFVPTGYRSFINASNAISFKSESGLISIKANKKILVTVNGYSVGAGKAIVVFGKKGEFNIVPLEGKTNITVYSFNGERLDYYNPDYEYYNSVHLSNSEYYYAAIAVMVLLAIASIALLASRV